MSLQREHPARNVVVIGAGVTGLTAAYRLHQRGHHVFLLEKNARPGGAIRSARRDGYLIEAGPNTMLLNDPAVLAFFEELGLGPELLEAAPEANKRYLVRAGRPVAAPMSPGQFVRTPLLSARAKWRLLAEPFVRRARADREESIADFVRRRLGAEVLERAVNPLIGGIYAGDPARLSIRHAFPTLFRFDRDHGSLLRGALAAGRARRRAGRPRFKSRSISFRGGLQAIIDGLVHVVGDSLYAEAEIESILPGAPWRVRFARAGEGSREISADAVLLTVPGHAAAQLPFAGDHGNPLTALADITYPPVASVAMGFRRDAVAHPLDGYGVLVPACEGRRILGTLFSSSLFPGRAPEGCVLLTSFVGGMRQPDLARQPEAALPALVLEDLRSLLGVTGPPACVHTHVWPRAIPQYQLGYARFHEVMEAAEERHPGLFIGGHIRDGVSVGDCIRAGWKLADRVG